MKRISHAEWLAFERRYYSGEFPHQRLGQAFVNTYYPSSGEATAKLFYVYDPQAARNIVFSEHIDWEV